MQSGPAITVFALHDWLPPHGESRVELRSSGADLVLTIFYYAVEGDEPTPVSRELRFVSTCAYYRASFPGPALLRIDRDIRNYPEDLGSLVEYPESAAAEAWTQYFGGRRRVRHFRVLFLSENLTVEVVAEGVELGEARVEK